jgi:hypothetical protein
MPPEEATSPVAEDTSAPGVAAEATAAAHDDEIDDRSLAGSRPRTRTRPAEGRGGRSEDGATKALPAKGLRSRRGQAPDVAEDGLAEIEIEGKAYRLPPELKDGMMRDADYRQKTHALAEQRKGFAAERQTWEQQREESRAALPEEHAKVALLSRDVAAAEKDLDTPLDNRGTTLRGIDWVAWRNNLNGLPDDDPGVLQFKQYRAAFDNANLSVEDGKRALAAAREDLTAKEQTRLTEQQQAHETALATARQQTGEALKAEGWTTPRRCGVVRDDGVRGHPEELLNVTDPQDLEDGRYGHEPPGRKREAGGSAEEDQ